MLASGHGGEIVNVGSVNSFLGFSTGSAYVASKHGQVGLTTSASAELAPHGIRVNIVCPGFIDTPMHHRGRAILGDDIWDKILIPRVHLRRAGRPEEIAQASSLPVLGRGQLHLGDHADTRRWVHADGVTQIISQHQSTLDAC